MNAYSNAFETGLYRDIKREDGKNQDADAIKDEWEYFAELSETYFWRNDYFPFTREDLLKYDPVGTEMIRKSWGIIIDYKIAITTWIGTVWLLLSMFVRMGDNSTKFPVEQVFKGGLDYPNDRYFYLNLALLSEWIIYFIVAFVEFIAWIIALNDDPMFFVVWAYVSIWLSMFLYGIPIILLIVHAFSNGT